MGQGLSRQDRALRRAIDRNSTDSIRQVCASRCCSCETLGCLWVLGSKTLNPSIHASLYPIHDFIDCF